MEWGFEIMLGYWQPLDSDVFLPTSREKFCEGAGSYSSGSAGFKVCSLGA